MKPVMRPKRYGIVEVNNKRAMMELIDVDWCLFLGMNVALVKFGKNVYPKWVRLVREL